MDGIRVENLKKEYSDGDRKLTILSGLTCSFEGGRSYGVVGRSGVGKSTLLHLLAGLDSPTGGGVFYKDQNISELSQDERARFRAVNVGFVFQAHHLLPEFTAIENVATPLLIAGQDFEFASERASKALQRVGLGERVNHYPAMLSGGEQQRVAIARAIVAEPVLLLADEPTGSLDIETAKIVQELLLDLQRSHGGVLVVVTHNPEFAAMMDVTYEMGVGGVLKEVIKGR